MLCTFFSDELIWERNNKKDTNSVHNSCAISRKNCACVHFLCILTMIESETDQIQIHIFILSSSIYICNVWLRSCCTNFLNNIIHIPIIMGVILLYFDPSPILKILKESDLVTGRVFGLRKYLSMEKMDLKARWTRLFFIFLGKNVTKNEEKSCSTFLKVISRLISGSQSATRVLKKIEHRANYSLLLSVCPKGSDFFFQFRP